VGSKYGLNSFQPIVLQAALRSINHGNEAAGIMGLGLAICELDYARRRYGCEKLA
jgi:hypothetical protein